MKELLSLNWHWDFVLNLSESDYPVKTLSKLEEFLTANKEKNFVKSHGREVQKFIQKQGLDKTFVECDYHMWRVGDRNLPWGIQIDGGSDWVALSRKFVQYVANDSTDDLVKGLIIVFKYTLLPAESFFHTVIRNSKFCNTYVDNNLHVTNWKRKLGCKCQYKHIVDWCGCSPNNFKPEDWLRIQNTENRLLFFARKFEPIINQAVIRHLELWLFKSDIVNQSINLDSYWQNVYHHLDIHPSRDEALMTVSDIAINLKCDKISSTPCNIVPSKIQEITSFHVNDSYQSTLVLFEALVNNIDVIILETSLRPKNKSILKKSYHLAQRLHYFSVSSDFDQKEQVLRNFPKTLGPYSELVLLYIFNASSEVNFDNHNVTVAWINPGEKLVEVNDFIVGSDYVIGHIKPSLKLPLLPGSWTVKLYNNNVVFAKLSFLVVPLKNNLIQDVHSDFSTDKNSNENKYYLFVNFYEIGDICTVKDIRNLCNISLPQCKNTSWSSLAPDPKSYI